MRIARPSKLLVVVAIALLGGCSYGLKPAGSTLPTAFATYLKDAGMTLTAAMPGPGVMSAEEIVAAVQHAYGSERLSGLKAVPVFGVLSCIEDGSCSPGPGALPGMNERTVWVLSYPDLAGWIIVDALTGLESGFEITID